VVRVIAQSPASGIATFSRSRFVSEMGRVRVAHCVSAIGAVEVPVFLRILSCSMTHYPEYE
jgi:hypothetical protein